MCGVSNLRVELYDIHRFKLVVLEGLFDDISDLLRVEPVFNRSACRTDVGWVKRIDVERDVELQILVLTDKVDNLRWRQYLNFVFADYFSLKSVHFSHT